MAEALAILGLISAIVQFVEFGGKIVERLDEFHSDVHEVPKTFQTLKVQLPLLINTLHRTQQQASEHHISAETATALKPLIDACSTEIRALQITLDKTLPSPKSSNWQRRLLALKSLARDKDVERSVANLEGHIRLLTYYQSTNNSDSSNKLLVLRQAQQAAPQRPRKAVFMVPFDRDETFVGRKDILDSINYKLNTSRRRAVLAGIGGVGKSRIAIQYCYQYQSDHPGSHVFWVHCGSVARFDEGYKEIARLLKLPGMQDPDTDIVKVVVNWLSDEDNGSWLLVLDNADDHEMFFGSARKSQSQDVLQRQLGMLVNYLPRNANGLILITTRDRRVGERLAERTQPIIVLPLGVTDANLMLRSVLPDHLDFTFREATELLERLQCLPLAITQAASYISEEGVTIRRYLELLRPGNVDSKILLEQDYYDSGRHPDIQNSVFQTWKISFDQIQKQAPRAAEILSLMSMLDKQSVPLRLLQDEEESPVIFDKALGTLKNFSLIQEEKSQQIYGTHRLVQLSMHSWLEQEKEISRWQEKALDVVFKCCPTSEDVGDWKAWDSISPHITIVRGHPFPQAEQKLKYAYVTSRLSRYYKARGRYKVASEMEEEALSVRQELLGAEHPDTLTSMNNMADVLSNQGKYEQAEPMHRGTLKQREVALGKEHPDTLTSMDNLARVLSHQGKYEQAEEMHRQALYLREAALGNEHPDTLTSMNNLANVLSGQGKCEQAEEMHQRTLRLREAVLGNEHPDTLTSVNNLAGVLSDQGKYERAEEMHRQNLRLRETTLGNEHPDTLSSMNNLADVLTDQGKHEKAEQIHRQTLRLKETALGKEHPSTLTSMNNLAGVLSDQGRYEQAEEIHRQTLGLMETALGKEHPSTITSMNNLAGVLSRQGRYEQAEEIHRETLRLREGSVGKEHPDTLTSMNNLANVLSYQSKYEQAEELHRETLRLREESIGKEHPDTLTSMNNLAFVLSDQGKYEQAEKIHRLELTLCERVLGKEHPDTLISMNNLAGVLSDQGKYNQAEEMHRLELSLCEMALGREHPDTIGSMNNLAQVLSHQGKYEQADEIHQQALKLRRTALGNEHPDTLTSMAHLARIWKSQGRVADAIRLMGEAEQLRTKVLGSDHPDTRNSAQALEEWLATT